MSKALSGKADGVPLPPKRSRKALSNKRRRHHLPGGRLKREEKHSRVEFVMTLVRNRFSYPEIAKAFAKKYNLTLKGAYLFLQRVNCQAVREMEEWDATTLINIFQRMVLSLEDQIKKAKADGDHKSVIQGELALARLFGFDKGTFIAALQENVARRRIATKQLPAGTQVDEKRELLAKDMHSLTVKELQAMLNAPEVEEALEIGHGIKDEEDSDEAG
jgi:hypothetical protein